MFYSADENDDDDDEDTVVGVETQHYSGVRCDLWLERL